MHAYILQRTAVLDQATWSINTWEPKKRINHKNIDMAQMFSSANAEEIDFCHRKVN